MKEVFVSQHPFIRDALTHLRDRESSSRDFAHYLTIISSFLFMEATRNVSLENGSVHTPLEETEGHRIASRHILVPILRAGLAMSEPIRNLFRDSIVACIGLYRDEESFEPVTYYSRLPAFTGDDYFWCLDPMLATGGSASAAISMIKKKGGKNISFIGVLAAPEGVEKLRRDHPDVSVILGKIDRCLNDQAYILPGLGDAGDRYFGTEGGGQV